MCVSTFTHVRGEQSLSTFFWFSGYTASYTSKILDISLILSRVGTIRDFISENWVSRNEINCVVEKNTVASFFRCAAHLTKTTFCFMPLHSESDQMVSLNVHKHNANFAVIYAVRATKWNKTVSKLRWLKQNSAFCFSRNKTQNSFSCFSQSQAVSAVYVILLLCITPWINFCK